MDENYIENLGVEHRRIGKYFVPFPYNGSKCWLLKVLKNKIESFIESHNVDMVVDLFGGAGTFIMNIKPKGRVQRIYNDVDRSLYCFFKVLTNPEDREKFLDLILYAFPHQDAYQEFRKELKSPDIPELFTAFYYFYVKCCSLSVRSFYAPTRFKKYEDNKLTRHKLRLFKLLQSKDFLDVLNHLTVYNLDYKILLKKVARPNSLIFLDPPYIQEGKQLYQHGAFSIEDHKILKDMILQGGSYYILTETNPILNEIWGPPKLEVIKYVTTNYAQYNPRVIKKEYIWSNIEDIEPQIVNLTKTPLAIAETCDNLQGGQEEDGCSR